MKTVYFLYCLSGFLSLGYQVVWFRVFVDRFGAMNLTFGLVICNFIGGLGLGSLLSKRVTSLFRTRIENPLRIYGAIELIIAITASLTLLLPLIPPHVWGSFPYQADENIYRPIFSYQIGQITIGAASIFLPCFFMGITFPLLCNTFQANSTFPSGLYAWNTLGACSAVLASEFILLPNVGHSRTLIILVLVNAGLGVYFLFRGASLLETAHAMTKRFRRSKRTAGVTAASSYPLSVALTCASISGLLAGALEADLFRRLYFLGCQSQASMSFVSFWAILAIFLASCTVRVSRRLTLFGIAVAYVVAFLVYYGTWVFAYPIRNWLHAAQFEAITEMAESRFPEVPGVLDAFWFGYGLKEVLLYSGLYVFPTFYLVALLLPHICNSLQGNKRHVGVAYGLNTLAFCIGMFGFLWIAPRVNIFYSLKLFILTFLLLTILLVMLRNGQPLEKNKWLTAGVVFVLLCFVTPRSFDASYFASDNAASHKPVRALKSNGAHTTFIVDFSFGSQLYFDNHSMSGTGPHSQRYMKMMAHFPLLLHSNPEKAMVVCFGVGNTVSAIAKHSTIDRIDVVDLNYQVFATAAEFAATNDNVIKDDRLTLINDDGRNFLKCTDRRYDLITSEPPPPMFQGVYRLYSQEYYRAVEQHLNPGGLMTQWLPIKQMPKEAVELAVSSFLNVFDHTLLFVGHDTEFILLGSNRKLDLARIEKRFHANEDVRLDLERIAIKNPFELYARIVNVDRGLRSRYGVSNVISDQRNELSYIFHDPYDPAVINFDPLAVLREFPTHSVYYARLRTAFTHLGMLKSLIEDFPESSLASVRNADKSKVALADVDWLLIGRLYAASKWLEGEQNQQIKIAFLRRIVAVSDQIPLIHLKLGDALVRIKNYSEALESYEQALRIDPDYELAKENKQQLITLMQTL